MKRMLSYGVTAAVAVVCVAVQSMAGELHVDDAAFDLCRLCVSVTRAGDVDSQADILCSLNPGADSEGWREPFAVGSFAAGESTAHLEIAGIPPDARLVRLASGSDVSPAFNLLGCVPASTVLRLPDGYRRVEYIEPKDYTKYGAYINTEYPYAADTRIECVVNIHGTLTGSQNDWAAVFGGRKEAGWTSGGYAFFARDGIAKTFTPRYNRSGDKVVGANGSLPTDKKVRIVTEAETATWQVEGDDVTRKSISVKPSEVTGDRVPLMVFDLGRQQANGSMSADGSTTWMKLYSFVASEGGFTVRNFIPCVRTSDETPGLYEPLNGTFHSNLGTQKMNAGSAVEYGTEDMLVIEGEPFDYGAPLPTYGAYRNLVAGRTFACQAPHQVSSEGGAAVCAGYSLYTNTASGVWTEWQSGAEETFTYVHPENTAVRLVWHWTASLPISVDDPVLVSSVGSAATVEIGVPGIGTTAESADLRLYWGVESNETALVNEVVVEKDIRTIGRYSAVVELPPSRVYYVQARLANDQGESARSSITRLALPVQGGFASAAVGGTGTNRSVVAVFDEIGFLSSDRLLLAVGNTASALSVVADIAVTSAENEFPCPIGDWNLTRYWELSAISISADGTTNVVATASGTMDSNDTATYTWTGGADQDFRAPGNWTPSRPDCVGYPRTFATAVFPSGEWTVRISDAANLSVLDLSAAGTRVHFIGAGADSSRIVVRSGCATSLKSEGGQLHLSGVTFTPNSAESADLYFAPNSVLTLDAGAVLDAPNKGIYVTEGTNVVRVLDGASAFVKDWHGGGAGSRLEISNATVTVSSAFCHHCNARPEVSGVWFCGSTPLLKVGLLLYTYRSRAEYVSPLHFIVPAGGYSKAPIQWYLAQSGVSNGACFPVTGAKNDGGPGLVFIEPDSPAIWAAETIDVPLIQWDGTRGIQYDNISFAGLPKRCRAESFFYWTKTADGYVKVTDEDGKPTVSTNQRTLGIHLKGKPRQGMVLLLR